MNEKLKKALETLKADITDAEVDSIGKALEKEFLPEWGVPKATFNEKIEAEKLAKSQLEETQKLLKEATSKADKTDEFKKRVEELEAKGKKDLEEYEAKLKDSKLSFAMKDALREAKAHNAEKAAAFIDKSKLVIGEDGVVSGLKDQIEALRKSDAYLFAEQEQEDESSKMTKPFFASASSSNAKPESKNTLENAINAAFGL